LVPPIPHAVQVRGKRLHSGRVFTFLQEESSGKRCRSADESSGAEDNNPTTKGKAAQSSSENGGGKKQQGKESATKPPAEAPKDYIHVRARRGEATDSHSLAERVRFALFFLAIVVLYFLAGCRDSCAEFFFSLASCGHQFR
jgi:hypothetical protein